MTAKRSWPWWVRPLLIGALAYAGVFIVLLALERKFIYRPMTAQEDWSEKPDARIQDLELPSATGESIHAWWLPRPGAEMVILNSHGNGGNLSHRGRSILRWSDELNASVMIYDYPGYGRSSGQPDEQSCYAAADSAWNWLIDSQKAEPKQVLLVGGSLGGAMATELAHKNDCRALVLLKAFSSIPDMAQFQFPWLPARYLVRHQFDNLAKLREVRRPVFVMHGTGDRIVPVVCGDRLFEAAREPKIYLRIEGDDHNDPAPPEFFSRLKQFLADHPVE